MKKLPLDPEHISELSQSLRRHSFFKGMSIGALERFMQITNRFEYPSGTTLFKKGDIGDALYVVSSGRVKIIERRFFIWPAKVIAKLQPGEIFGEMALLDQPHRTATAVTYGLTTLFVILSTNFNELLRSNPEFSKELHRLAEARVFEQKHRTGSIVDTLCP